MKDEKQGNSDVGGDELKAWLCRSDLQEVGSVLWSGVWSMEYGVWSMEYGVWSMEYGVWSMEYGVWSMESGVWSLESIVCSLVWSL